MTEYEQQLFEDITTLKGKVRHILNKYPQTRNSDRELATRVAIYFDLDPVKIASVVERIRRQYNSKGEFLPTIEEVAKQRKMNIDVWKKALGYENKLF